MVGEQPVDDSGDEYAGAEKSRISRPCTPWTRAKATALTMIAVGEPYRSSPRCM